MTIAPIPALVAYMKDISPLLVKDSFDRAVHNASTVSYYVLVTVVNDTTGETQRVCITGGRLFWAVGREHKTYEWKRDRLLMRNTARVFHFSNPEAWQTVQPGYSPEMVAQVEEEFRGIRTVDISQERIHEKISAFFDDVVKTHTKTSAQFDDYIEALVCVFTERGLFVGRSNCRSGGLFIVTPQRNAEFQKLIKPNEARAIKTATSAPKETK